MKIKMKNEEIVQCMEMTRTLKEKGRLGYAIMRNQRKMEEATTEYRKIKEDAIQKYGENRKLPDGTEIRSVPKDKFSKFWYEIKEIALIEEEADVFTVSEEEFYSGNLTSDQMDKLFWMVDIPKEPGKGGSSNGDSREKD